MKAYILTFKWIYDFVNIDCVTTLYEFANSLGNLAASPWELISVY